MTSEGPTVEFGVLPLYAAAAGLKEAAVGLFAAALDVGANMAGCTGAAWGD